MSDSNSAMNGNRPHIAIVGAGIGGLTLAYRLAQRSDGESTLIFDLEIAPAYPLDLIRITFLQDRHTASVRSLLEAVDG